MGSSVGDLDTILRVIPASPSRRDYGIRTPPRSLSPVRGDGDHSTPQSPWRHVPTGSDFEAFRYYENHPPPLVLDRSSYYSGPLPAAPSTPGRSTVPSYSGPLPSHSGPLPSFTAATTDSFEFATWARMYHQHVNDGNSVLGSLDGDSGSSHESSFREGKGDVQAKQNETTSVHYLPAASPATMEFSARAGMHSRVGSRSGELGRSDDSIAMQKTLASRQYKSGELSGLDIAATFGGLDVVRQQRWENLNKEATPSEAEPMVTIPFKWDEASSKSRSRSPSISSKKSIKSAPIGAGAGDFSFGSSHAKSSAEEAESVNGSEASAVSVASKPVKAAATPVAKPPKKAAAVHSAVPFKWEDAPGKPKLGDTKATTETKTPALQLPPRLASATVKRGSWSTSTPSVVTKSRSRSSSTASLKTRPTTTPSSQTSPTSSTSSKQSRRALSEIKPKSSRKASSQTSPAPEPTPLPERAPEPTPSQTSAAPEPALSPEPAPVPSPPSPSPQEPRHTLGPKFMSSPLDASAKPQVESTTASKSGPISQLGLPQHDFFSVRSPTSTLQGPGSNVSSSRPSSSKTPSVTYSHSGTSAESLEHWSDADQSIHGHDSSDPESSTTRKRSSSRSKPPLSPIPASSNLDKTPAEDDCMDPPTRLPYKMPETTITNTCQDIVVSKPASRRTNSRCFDLPKFAKTKGSEDENVFTPSTSIENGYRSPTYKATLDLLSPSPSVTPATTKTRGMKLGSSSPRHFVEGICNSLKHSFHKISRRSSKSTKPVEDSFMKRHPALGL